MKAVVIHVDPRDGSLKISTSQNLAPGAGTLEVVAIPPEQMASLSEPELAGRLTGTVFGLVVDRRLQLAALRMRRGKTRTLERMKHRLSAVLAALFGVLASAPASANIGLPMIAVFLPPLWVALIPIILVESAVLTRGTGAPFRASLGAVAMANVVSTIIGVPVLWFLLATVELICCGGALGLGSVWTKVYAVTVQAPWLIPYEKEFGWMIPAALATLAVVFMVMSVFVETPIVSRITKVSGSRLWSSMWAANIGSYVLLGLGGVLMAALSLKLEKLQQLFMPLSESVVEAVFFIALLFASESP